MRRALAAAVVLVPLALAGCGDYDETTVAEPEPSTAAPSAPSTLEPCTNNGKDEVRSYDPDNGSTDGAAVRRIRDRGKLVAGVAADTELLGARDPNDNQLEGFDIDMVREVARAIWPDDDPDDIDSRITYNVITAAQRIPYLQDGTVDVVVRNMTVNCARWQQIAFSAVYYDAGQKVMVGKDSGFTADNLSDARLCAPAGTTSLENITEVLGATAVSATDNSACMVLFQNGEADGVSTDDTVLAGLAAQDPYAQVLDTERYTQEPYGIGVNADDVDLVRLINQRLESMRSDGDWQRLYDTWLKGPLGPGKQPEPRYGR